MEGRGEAAFIATKLEDGSARIRRWSCLITLLALPGCAGIAGPDVACGTNRWTARATTAIQIRDVSAPQLIGELRVGDSVPLHLEFLGGCTGTTTARWLSTNSDVARVDRTAATATRAVVTALSAGETMISAEVTEASPNPGQPATTIAPLTYSCCGSGCPQVPRATCDDIPIERLVVLP